MSALNITSREKNAVLIGVVFLVLFFGYQLGIGPVIDKKKQLTTAIAQKQTAVTLMRQQMEQYRPKDQNSDEMMQQIRRRPAQFSLFSFLDTQILQAGLKENVDYMKPQTRNSQDSAFTIASVKIQLKQVYLKELITFLYRIENSGNGVSITSLSLSKGGKEKELLDAVLEAQTLVPSVEAKK